MRCNSDNFLEFMRTIVTGGGKLSVTPFGTTTPQLSTLEATDGGINEDVTLSLGDANLGSTTVSSTDSQGLRILITSVSSTNGSTNSFGTFGWVVPRDYDVTADKCIIRVVAAMNGGTDTPTISVASSTLLPLGTLTSSGLLNSTVSLTNGKTVVGSTVTALSPLTISSTLSSTQAVFEFDLSGLGLIRDTFVSLQITTGNHNTNKAILYSVNLVYAWTIVAFTDSYLNGTDPADLAGTDAFGRILR